MELASRNLDPAPLPSSPFSPPRKAVWLLHRGVGWGGGPVQTAPRFHALDLAARRKGKILQQQCGAARTR